MRDGDRADQGSQAEREISGGRTNDDTLAGINRECQSISDFRIGNLDQKSVN